MKKPTQGVYVRWHDTVGRDGWCRTGPRLSVEHRSIGWLLEEDPTGILISASTGGGVLEENGAWDYTVDAPMYIPRCAILKMQTWKPPGWVILD